MMKGAMNATAPSNPPALQRAITALIRHKYLYLLMSPALVWYVVYRYIPIYGLTIAFKNFNFGLGIWGSPWVGLKHFQYLFGQADFYAIIRNTLLINLYNLLISFPAPIILALLLNEITNRTFKRSIQTVVYFPHFISWVVYGGIIIFVLSPTTGIVNQAISFFGGEPVFFMARSKYFRAIVVVTNILKESGWGAIVYLAALSGVDVEQYEAAIVDGASKWQKLRYITLPNISNTIIIMLILRVGYLLDVGFEQIYILSNPAIRDVADVLSTYIYRMGVLNMQFSVTTAIGLFQAVIGFALIFITNRVAKRYSEVSMW